MQDVTMKLFKLILAFKIIKFMEMHLSESISPKKHQLHMKKHINKKVIINLLSEI
jgi:hypothetical protein